MRRSTRWSLRKAGVAAVGEILTVHSAPDQIIAMLSVDFDDHISAREVERLVCEIEDETAAKFPDGPSPLHPPMQPGDRLA